MPLPINLYGDLYGGFGNSNARPPMSEEERQAALSRAPEGAPRDLAAAANPGPLQPPPPQEPVDPGTFSGTAGDTGGGNDEAYGAELGQTGMDYAAPLVGLGGAQGGPTVMGAGVDYGPWPGGEEDFTDTFSTKPNQIADIYNKAGDAEEQKWNQTAQTYADLQKDQAQQAAVLRQRAETNSAEIRLRQQALEDTTQRYSNDLADRGQFWRNPGNIIAAFGAALMTLGSDDHAIGMKLINNAVQADFSQRKALADSHLGELKSNLASYRQIMGDEEQGDRLAMAESYRVGSMELQRISAQFQGPIAKAKAQAASKQLLMQSQQLKAGVYMQALYQKAHAEQSAIAQAIAKTSSATGGKQAFVPYGGQPGQLQAGGKNVGGSAQTGQGPSASSGQAQTSSGKAPSTPAQAATATAQGSQALASVSSDAARSPMSDRSEYDLDKRYPGSKRRLDVARKMDVEEVLAQSELDPNIYRPGMNKAELQARILASPGGRKSAVKYNEKMVALRNAARADNEIIGKQLQPLAERTGLFRQLGQDQEIIEKTAAALKMSPDALVDTRWDQVVGQGRMKALNEFLASGDAPAGPHEEQQNRIKAAISRHKQLRSGAVNQYFKETSGSAVSETESERLKNVINGDNSWASFRNFQKIGSQAARNEGNVAKGTAKTELAKALWDIGLGTESHGASYTGIDGPGASRNPDGPGNTGQNANAKERSELLRRATEKLKKGNK